LSDVSIYCIWVAFQFIYGMKYFNVDEINLFSSVAFAFSMIPKKLLFNLRSFTLIFPIKKFIVLTVVFRFSDHSWVIFEYYISKGPTPLLHWIILTIFPKPIKCKYIDIWLLNFIVLIYLSIIKLRSHCLNKYVENFEIRNYKPSNFFLMIFFKKRLFLSSACQFLPPKNSILDFDRNYVKPTDQF
jgi:hypothetical protein